MLEKVFEQAILVDIIGRAALLHGPLLGKSMEAMSLGEGLREYNAPSWHRSNVLTEVRDLLPVLLDPLLMECAVGLTAQVQHDITQLFNDVAYLVIIMQGRGLLDALHILCFFDG